MARVLVLDEVGLEHRLTNIEANTKDTLEQLTKLNGKVARHEEFINDAKLSARETKGFVAGRASIHKRDMAILAGILAVFQFVLPFVPKIYELLTK